MGTAVIDGVVASDPMDAHQALADLAEISSQIQAAVLIGPDDDVSASTISGEGRSQDFARAARELLAAAETVRSSGGETLTQLEVATREGSIFVVRDGGRTIAATTSAEPTVGLVFYDLKSCLRSVTEEEEAPPPEKPKRARKQAEKKAAEGDAA
jgi:predicted regulator of Ras-like GTPase activity (Roadblock/LC7/MglB family)